MLDKVLPRTRGSAWFHTAGAPSRDFLALFTKRERLRGSLLVCVAIVMALVETLGVASIMPFLAVLGQPSVIETNPILASAYEWGGFTSRNDFLIALGFLTLAVVVSTSLVRAAAQYVILHFSNMRRYSIGMRLLERYLAQPYYFFLNRNSADLVKRVLSDVDMIVDGWLVPAVQMVAYGIVAVALVGLLVLVDPLIAFIVFGVVGASYAAIYLASRVLVARIGRERNISNRERFNAAAEVFGGIKEVKLLGREAAYAARYSSLNFRFARHKAVADTIAKIPRYLIEAVGFGGVVLLALSMMQSGAQLGEMLPLLGLYAFAGYRLLPAVQNVYHGLTHMRFYSAVVTSVAEDLSNHVPDDIPQDDEPPLPFVQSVRFDNVTFRYPGAAWPALSAASFEISANSTVGLVGMTGAGKTTAVDLMLGLLTPSEGRLLVDGVELTKATCRRWQKNIGYVPQSIFLADSSVAQNIAFGIPRAAIDMAAVERAARLANIHDFIVNDLPRSYETEVGERGVRLSGGQRQRIGIARALYNDPPVLVFDEATNALDDATELAVMEALNTLQHQKTIVIIAHRLSSLEKADAVFEVTGGRIVPFQAAKKASNPSYVQSRA